MRQLDDLLAANAAHAEAFGGAGLDRKPARRLAIVACMDARVDPLAALGLRAGDAHVIRNAGAVVTDAEIRALAVSQRVLGTRDVLVLVHTDCGMRGLDEDALRGELEAETGVRRTGPRCRCAARRRTPGPRSSASLEPVPGSNRRGARARLLGRQRPRGRRRLSGPSGASHAPDGRRRTHRSDH